MDQVELGVDVHVDNGTIVLRLVGDRQLGDPVTQLCTLLSTSSCSEFPCMILVRPYFAQLRWTFSGDLEEISIDHSRLPTWPLDIFVPVSDEGDTTSALAPYLFGIDNLTDKSLAGFEPCDDLMLLLKKGLLSLNIERSQLSLSIASAFKSEVQQNFRGTSWLKHATSAWELCLHCIPDPYTDILWNSHLELLRPVIVTDVLPLLLILENDSDPRIAVASISRNEITRALCAYASASMTDIGMVNSFVSSSLFIKAYASSDSNDPCSRLLSLLDKLAILKTSFFEHTAQCEASHELPSLHMPVHSKISEMLSTHSPYGHLAILDLYRILAVFGTGGVIAQARRTLAEYSISVLHEEGKHCWIDEVLGGAICEDDEFPNRLERIGNITGVSGDSVSIRNRLKIVTFLSGVLAISFYRSSLSEFETAILGLHLAWNIIQHRLSSGFRICLVAASEIMRCLNATGDEACAIRTMSQALLLIMNELALRHVIRTDDTTKAMCSRLNFALNLDSTNLTRTPTLSNCQSCGSEHGGLPQCIFCVQLSCLQFLTDQLWKSSREKYSQISGTIASNEAVAQAETTTSRDDQTDIFRARSIATQFELIAGLIIMLADSYIGTGHYDKAAQILETLPVTQYEGYHRWASLLALRFSRIARRRNVSLSNDAKFVELLDVLSASPKAKSSEVYGHWLDEIESTLNQDLASSEGNRSLAASLLRTLPPDIEMDSHARQISERLGTFQNEPAPRSRSHFTEFADSSGTGAETESAMAYDDMTADMPAFVFNEDVQKEGKDLEYVAELYAAVQLDDERTVASILDQGVSPDIVLPNGRTSLQTASSAGYPRLVKLLLDRGARLEAKDNIGSTPLFVASFHDNVDIVKLLLDRGANVDAANHYGSTALHTASSLGFEDVVKLLLDRGANVNAANSLGATALYKATTYGHKDVVELLLDRGADIDAVTSTNHTALHRAYLDGHKIVARFLIDRGARLDIENDKGVTGFILSSLNDMNVQPTIHYKAPMTSDELNRAAKVKSSRRSRFAGLFRSKHPENQPSK